MDIFELRENAKKKKEMVLSSWKRKGFILKRMDVININIESEEKKFKINNVKRLEKYDYILDHNI